MLRLIAVLTIEFPTMYKYFVILIAVFSTNELFGQDSTSTDDCHARTIKYGFIEKPYHRYQTTYEMGGKLLSKDQLIERLYLFPESAKEYDLFKKSIKVSWISFAIGFPLLIAGDIYGRHQGVSTGGLLAGSVILAYTIQIPGFLAIKHRKRSLNLYNKRICER